MGYSKNIQFDLLFKGVAKCIVNFKSNIKYAENIVLRPETISVFSEFLERTLFFFDVTSRNMKILMNFSLM